jgi:ligand-binding sensor domain-containing protein
MLRKNMKYILVYTSLLMLACNTSCGQKQTEPHKDNFDYDIKDTVTSYGPNTMVRNIKQGSNGTILIAASWGGVFRYDGKSFTNIASKIGSRRYWDVLEDRHGNIWFATTHSGVYNYNGKTFKHFTTKEGLVNNSVFSIYEDKAGTIWFGTGDGISRYDGRSFQNFTIKAGDLSNVINTIIEDKTGKLWIGTRGDVYIYDGRTFTAVTDKDGKTFKNVWGITEDKKCNIWLGADGLLRYDGITFTKVSQTGAKIIEDKKGNIWTIGAINASTWALSRYDQKSLYTKNATATEIMSGGHALVGILEADDGNIWIGALDGVYRYDGKTVTDFKNKKVQH